MFRFVVSVSAATRLYYHTAKRLSTTFFIFFKSFRTRPPHHTVELYNTISPETCQGNLCLFLKQFLYMHHNHKIYLFFNIFTIFSGCKKIHKFPNIVENLWNCIYCTYDSANSFNISGDTSVNFIMPDCSISPLPTS